MPATSFKSRITAIALARCSRLCNPFLNSYIESEQDELLVFSYAALSPHPPHLSVLPCALSSYSQVASSRCTNLIVLSPPYFTMLTRSPRASVSNMLNRLHGQPESYDKKYVFPPR